MRDFSAVCTLLEVHVVNFESSDNIFADVGSVLLLEIGVAAARHDENVTISDGDVVVGDDHASCGDHENIWVHAMVGDLSAGDSLESVP